MGGPLNRRLAPRYRVSALSISLTLEPAHQVRMRAMRGFMSHPAREMDGPPRPYTLEFYVDPETGTEPVLEWIKKLSPFQRRSIGIGVSEILERDGINVCDTEYGKNLGQGLFEFRLRHGADDIAAMFTKKEPDATDKEPVLLRVYCHAYGEKVVLLVAGYDKKSDPSKKRENTEIKLARKRLTEFRARRQARRQQRARKTTS